MADLFEYLSWRADVPFSVDPFNEVDNLILSELAYADFSDIVPSDGTAIPLSIMCEMYFETHDRQLLKKESSFLAKAPLLMDGMLNGARFQNMSACFYVNNIVPERHSQMSAITFLLDDGTMFIAFRGTDNSLTGWREDFDLSYIAETHGQELAVKYLELVASRFSYPMRVGGHSKGGNFAVFSASFCESLIQERIITVYSNDGPDFREDVIKAEGYLRVLPKVLSIIPDTSVIGLLLSSLSDREVIRSTATGIMQHDGFTWSVNRNRFVPAELSDTGIFINRAIDSWIDKLDDNTRRSFTQTVFSIIEATEKDSFHEIAREKLKSLTKMIGSMQNIPKDKQTELLRLAGQLLQSGGQVLLEQLPNTLAKNKENKADS